MLKRYIKLIPFCSKNTFNVFNGHVILYRIYINISIYLFISISVSKKIYLGRNRQAVRLAITATKKKQLLQQHRCKEHQQQSKQQ